jgi:vacuolar protein sorting-associated protein 13A/C
MVFESFAAGLVERYVAPYADVDLDTLRYAVREGKVTLSDVQLKTSAFDSLGFPLTVRSGRVGELQIDVTWSALTAKPAKVHLRDVTVVIGPSGSEASAETRNERLALLQEELLRGDEESRVLRLCGAAAPSLEEQSFGMRTVAAAIGALEVEISNVHVRYEDNSSDASSPFAFGITLEKLSLFSVDGQWRATPASQAELSAVAHKMLKVEGLAMYWQHGEDSVGGAIKEAVHITVPQGGVSPSDPYHVISPLAVEVKMSLNRMGVPSNGAPRISGDIKVLGTPRVNIDCATMRGNTSFIRHPQT